MDDHRTEIAAARGLVITLDDPSIVDWDLPMGIPGQSYSVTFKAEGGVGPYSWCLWEFTNDDEFDYCADACPQGLEELGCLFEDVTPHDPEKENDDPDCLCPTSVTPVGARVCPCVCGLPEGFTFSGNGDTATISGTYPQNPASCFEFVLGVMDSSESLYTGQHQKYLRRFRIRTGVELNTSDGGGYDTYVSEGDSTNHCAENKLVVSKDGSGGADGRVTFLRFDREEAGISADYLAVGGELILHATDDGDLTDVTLYYVEEGGVGDCRKQYAAFPDCGDAVWGDWDAMDPDYVVPIARICSIQAGQHVRFDVTPYLTKRYLDCVNQIPYYQFVIASNETNAGRGFHASGSTTGDPPRLTFIHTTFSTANENNQRCEDCRDNDCDGLVDCEDTAQCDPCDP
ncbi:MAG: hypothetical protein FLDDKLPJ_01728 [Phycisphaerae bacterium]|nr:hypothetical protein [Phycisphaerae bacterium]